MSAFILGIGPLSGAGEMSGKSLHPFSQMSVLRIFRACFINRIWEPDRRAVFSSCRTVFGTPSGGQFENRTIRSVINFNVNCLNPLEKVDSLEKTLMLGKMEDKKEK